MPRERGRVRELPQAIYARFFGFREQEYFEVPPEAQKVPKVDFGTR